MKVLLFIRSVPVTFLNKRLSLRGTPVVTFATVVGARHAKEDRCVTTK